MPLVRPDWMHIILIGHTMDLAVGAGEKLPLVGGFYQRTFIMPENPGFATAMGVLVGLEAGNN
jgi:hypothetical protein